MPGISDIVLSPDPRLRQRCAPIDEVTSATRRLAKRMLRDMYAADGCGLAAPQVGELVQMVVIDVDYADGQKNPYVLINPEVVETSEETMVTGEGCLSFPGITVPVARPRRVVVQAENLDGDLMQYEAEGNLLAVCLQHEIDHLAGITMLDHLAPADRVKAIATYNEALAAGARPGDTASDME